MSLLDYRNFFIDNDPLEGELVSSLEGSDEAVEEIEYMFLVKLEDMSQLERAKDIERQEQWSMIFRKDNVETIIRVRKSFIVGKRSKVFYFLCSKINFIDLDGKWELEKEVAMEHFDKVKSIAENGLIKDRYTFPMDGTDMVWEVDVFKDKDGNPDPWVKIDLEVKQRMDIEQLIANIPFDYSEGLFGQYGERSEEEDKKFNQFFDSHVITR